MIKKIIASVVAFFFVAVVSVHGYLIVKMDLADLLISSTNDTFIYMPKDVCRVYLFYVRDTDRDIKQFDEIYGLSFVMSATDELKDRFMWVEFFIDAGMDVNGHGGQGGYTPLHSAIIGNDTGGVQYLLNHGADPLILDETFHLNAYQFLDFFDEKNLKLDPSIRQDRSAIYLALENFKKTHPG